ncbi:MAG: hypothetical protein JWN52_4580 [Actinomycetia bacterium]|nr:hypothetical protein [Actinomycetes bacterium]
MSDENDQRVAGPPGDPGDEPVSSQSPPPPAAEAPVTAPPGVSRRERLRRVGGRRPVQLLAAGVIGAIIGGAVVGTLGAVTEHDDHRGFAEYGRHGGPFMRGDGPSWRFRGGGPQQGGGGWYGPGPRQWQVPDQGGLPQGPVPVPAQPAPASPVPVSPTPSATAS